MLSFQGIILLSASMGLVFIALEYFMPNEEKKLVERYERMKVFSLSRQERKKHQSLMERIYGMIEEVVIRRFGEHIKRGGSLAPLQLKLIQAGVKDVDPLQHRTKRLILGGVMGLVGFSLGDMAGAAIFGGAGLFYPDYRLRQIKKQREFDVLEEFPDYLDLLSTTYPAANGGLEDAVERIYEKEQGIISSEFQAMVDELHTGKVKRDSLRGIAQRLGVKEVEEVIAQIIHADMLGTELENTLKSQAERMRSVKASNAEIKARQANIIILLPSVFLLLTIILVVAGPFIVEALEAFQMF